MYYISIYEVIFESIFKLIIVNKLLKFLIILYQL